MSKEQDLRQLHELEYELSKIRECQNKTESLNEEIIDSENIATEGTNEYTIAEEHAVNSKVSKIRGAIITFIQVIALLLMLAVAVYSFYIFINAMKAAGVEVGLYVFFGIIHGAVCIALIAAASFFTSALK